jgi:hypothetical protein
VVHQEHVIPVVEDGARRTDCGPRNRELFSHRMSLVGLCLAVAGELQEQCAS